MQVLPVKTQMIREKDDLTEAIVQALKNQCLELKENDILALSSKIVSYAEGRLAKLSEIKSSKKAKSLAKRYALAPAFAELVLRESDTVVGGVPKAVLTLNDGVYTVNAGIDNKNAPKGFAILWPSDPQRQVERIRDQIFQRMGKRVGIIIVDSTVTPGRWGTRGLAIGVAGFEPVKDYRKTSDLYGKKVLITLHAVADDLASTAHLVMGESAERTPVAIMRDAPVTFTDHVNPQMMKIMTRNDVYNSLLKPKRIMSRIRVR